MISRFLNKTISIFTTMIFLSGLFPPVIFSQPGFSLLSGEARGFNKTIIDNSFSRADRELNPERWLAEAKIGLSQAICSWELIASSLYEDPSLFEETKNNLINWSNNELEARFSEWLISRFFGETDEKTILEFSRKIKDNQKKYSWSLDNKGNVIFDDRTGYLSIIHPNEEDMEFSKDLIKWRNDTGNIINASGSSYENTITGLFPELLAYIPPELRESMTALIREAISEKNDAIKCDFENIAAREERIFTSRRTSDIASLHNQSKNGDPISFTDKLITETDEICKTKIKELNTKIEQAEAGAGDLVLLGEEWLRLYKEQFEKGLKAWEDAEERFFIRRIEWEQDSFRLFSEGDDIWFAAFKKFEKERNNWELNAKKLFESGEMLFVNLSEDLEKTIQDAKNEFELNMAMRAEEGTAKVKALIDMYLTCASTALSMKESIYIWQKNYGYNNYPVNPDFLDWFSNELLTVWNNIAAYYMKDIEAIANKNIGEILSSASWYRIFDENYKPALYYTEIQKIINRNMTPKELIDLANNNDFKYFPIESFKELNEIYSLYNSYLSYKEKALDIRNKIYKNYNELFDTGTLKDILLPGTSSEDFFLDEYQLALVKAEALVLYWERETAIAEAVINYADDISSDRITETEGKLIWEEAKEEYNKSLESYEIEIKKLSEAGVNIQKQQEVLTSLSLELQKEEEKLTALYDVYKSHLSINYNADYYSSELNKIYNNLVDEYKNFEKTGNESVYKDALLNGLLWGLAIEQEDTDKKWQSSLEPLVSLLKSYGYTCESYYLPEVQDICEIIFNKPGDFTQNTAGFLTEFDKCFSTIPKWLETEIDSWKNAFINYVSSFAFYYEITPQVNPEQLILQQEKLITDWNALISYLNSSKEIKNEEIETINNSLLINFYKRNSLNYVFNLLSILENLNTSFLENNAHWRQSIDNEYFNNGDYPVNFVSSWSEGNFVDAYCSASYYTNRLNDAFLLFSKKESFKTSNRSSFYSTLYSNEYSNISNRYNSLLTGHIDLLNILNSYKLSILTSKNIMGLKENDEKKFKEQELIYNKKREQYLIEADNLLRIASVYDEQYSVLKKAHADTDLKRFEYEKQDAIQRRTNTSYISSNDDDYENNKIKLEKAQTVLNVLSDLYSNEEYRSNKSTEYNELYSAYKQSFNRKMKVQEIITSFFSAITEQKTNNAEIYKNYQNALYYLGSVNQDYSGYFLPENLSEWTEKNIITVKNGKLTFSRNNSMKITGVNESIKNDLINYFKKEEISNNELIKISKFDEALRSLNQRMSGYLSDPSKFEVWSLARNHLLSSLIEANPEITFLKSVFSEYGELTKIGSVGTQLAMHDEDSSKESLYDYIKNKSIYANAKGIYLEAWNKLSLEEQADLEFYIIITLTNTNDYSGGFSLAYTKQIYEYVYNYVEDCYDEAVSESNRWYNFLITFIWDEMKSVNKNTLKRITPILNKIKNETSYWVRNLQHNQTSIINLYSDYITSRQELDNVIKSNEKNIKWEDISNSLSNSFVNQKDIKVIETYWNTMRKEISNIEYSSVYNALISLFEWTKAKENNSKLALNNYWNTSVKAQQKNENDFLLAVNNYISGDIDIKTLKSSAEKAYGKNSSVWKNHYINMHDALLSDLSLFMDSDYNFIDEFSVLGEELLALTQNTIEYKYLAEYNARESEWQIMQNNILKKYHDWKDSVLLILEIGRKDWIANNKKMEDAYKKWYLNFQEEYERINNEWEEIYLAGLMDKEKWLKQAEKAANHASSEAFLSLVGTEGERLSRFVDTREPFGIRDAVPKAQSLVEELLQSPGIVNMTNALISLTNYAGITSPLVRRGMGGITSWDASSAKITASDLAKKSSAEIANNEAKILAYNVKQSIDKAINELTANVETANKNFREGMDDLFVYKGLWRKSGNNYVKDIVKGSTLFAPIISETVNIKSYLKYIMEPIILKTNLEEYNIQNLNSIAINKLVENAQIEVKKIASEIFGFGEKQKVIEGGGEKREQSPGKFGAHIGYAPDTKASMGKKRNEMFFDEGAGELGRLVSEFTYWAAIDSLGMNEVAMAPWDKRMWNDEGSGFTAPSLRTTGQIAGAIAAAVVSVVATPFTGGASLGATVASVAFIAAISTSNDLLFGTLDTAYGYKTLDEAAFEVGKSYTTNFTSGLLTAGFSGIGGSIKGAANITASAASTTAGTIATQTLVTGAQTITSGISTSLLNGITYNNENGFGYSEDIAAASMKNTFSNALVSMTSTLTSTSLTALNSGFNFEKLTGFEKLNQTDLQKLNNLTGSVAGQGINYALGNDFTLNLLNFNLLSGNSGINTGLLELHLGHGGTSMNFGTGGANVSIDNLTAAFRGAQVWNVNNNISNYIKDQSKEGGNGFDSAVTLRAQYGYGNDVQKNQLWEILNGDAIIKTDSSGGYLAETTIDENGNRVINLSGYQQGMSTEDQFLLATIFGHEAYRDGYVTGKTDSSGNYVTAEASFTELRDASIGRLAMGDRINAEHNWFYDNYEGLAFESLLFGIANQTGNYTDFNDYLEFAYNNDGDYQWLFADTGGDYQNNYKTIPLFNSAFQARVNTINEKKLQVAYNRYYADKANHETQQPLSLNEFAKENSLSLKYGYRAEAFYSIAQVGCMFMSTKYGIEALTGEKADTIKLHNYIKNNKYYDGDNLLSNELMAKIMTEYTNRQYIVQLYDVYNSQPSAGQLSELGASEEIYLAHLRIKEPDKTNAIIHSVMVSGIEYQYDNEQISGVAKINAANSLTPSTYFNSRSDFLLNEIVRWDIFKITKNY